MPKAGRGGGGADGGNEDVIFLAKDSGIVKPATEANVGDRIIIDHVEYVVELKREFNAEFRTEFPHATHSLGLSRPKGKTAYTATLFTSGLTSDVVSLGGFTGSGKPVVRRE